MGRGGPRAQDDFLFLGRSRGKHSAWLRANLIREQEMEARGMSLP